MVNVKREISKEVYEESKNLGWEALEEKFCTRSEICGYGVYSIKVLEENGKYYVNYSRGSSCD